MTKRYAKRRTGDGLWEVYYVPTGSTVVTDGPLSQLEEHEADEALELLERMVEEEHR
ncbi:hypothetical protein [Chelativorans sp.]|uniref:hypothetical protein n=1 Tax=Chelativorans sp. TaxID=2203393 RepID=UPI00281265BF|nr:hypothetical protein [Chelativorans sp.]